MKIVAVSPALVVLFLHTAATAQQAPGPAGSPPSGPPAYPAPAYPPQPQPYPQPYPGQPQYPQQQVPQPAQQPYPPPPQYPQQPDPQPQAPPQYPQPQPPTEQPTAPPQPPRNGPQSPYRAPPVYYYYPPPAAHRGIYRPFNMTAGMGVALLSLPVNPRENQVGYNYLARLGFGLSPDFIIYVGIDGTGISHPEYDVNQTNYLLGVQYFVIPRLYLRGGIGIAGISDDDNYVGGSGAGQAFLAGVGIELVQGDSLAFALELTSSLARFRYGATFSNALSFSLSFF
jgi:hypothetical protein